MQRRVKDGERNSTSVCVAMEVAHQEVSALQETVDCALYQFTVHHKLLAVTPEMRWSQVVELHFPGSGLSPVREVDVSPRIIEVPAEMSFSLAIVVASLRLLMGLSRKCASHLAQFRLSNGRTTKPSPPPPTPFELLMARCERLSDHISTKPSAGRPSNAHREGAWCPSCQKTMCFVRALNLWLFHTEKQKRLAASRTGKDWGGFHRGLCLPVLADRSTPKMGEEKHMTPDSVYYI